MKTVTHAFAIVALLALARISFANPNAGFFLPESVTEMKIKFKNVNNLIVIPVTINDSIHVNLILDTGCRNLVLFGKRFEKLLTLDKKRPVIFSGLGAGNSVKGYLSIGNHASIQEVHGEKVPVVVVAEKNLFGFYSNIHGVIGYDIFLKFEIEIDSKANILTFRPAAVSNGPEGFTKVPLEIVDSRPILASNITFYRDQQQAVPLMIDTGSSLGLLLKTTDVKRYHFQSRESIIGRGLNGDLSGYKTRVNQLVFGNFSFGAIQANVIISSWHNHASVGMEVLRDYIVVLNYCKAYACFKKIT